MTSIKRVQEETKRERLTSGRTTATFDNNSRRRVDGSVGLVVVEGSDVVTFDVNGSSDRSQHGGDDLVVAEIIIT